MRSDVADGRVDGTVLDVGELVPREPCPRCQATPGARRCASVALVAPRAEREAASL